MAQKIKTILISQPKPTTEKSPYFDLAEKLKLTIDFRPFIHVEGVDAHDFRQQRIDLAEHTAVIMTSRNAVDHFFRLAEEMRFEVPDTMKYFCLSESTAFYLQKYVVYRKRKIFHGQVKFQELMDLIKKHKSERFLLPCSDLLKPSIPQALEEGKINYTRATMYRTVASDLSDLSDVKYDMLVFYSPGGIESLFRNFHVRTDHAGSGERGRFAGGCARAHRQCALDDDGHRTLHPRQVTWQIRPTTGCPGTGS